MAPPAGETADTLMTLFFAAAAKKSGGILPAVDYKIMSALSQGKYTPSALEHRFRDWRKNGKALAEQAAGEEDRGQVLSPTKSTTSQPKASQKRQHDAGVTEAHATKKRKLAASTTGSKGAAEVKEESVNSD